MKNLKGKIHDKFWTKINVPISGKLYILISKKTYWAISGKVTRQVRSCTKRSMNEKY